MNLDELSIEKLTDARFWLELCPDLTVTDDQALTGEVPTLPLRTREWELSKELISEEGYFAYPSFFATQQMDRLASCLERLESRGLIPGFCFVYDEFWQALLALDPLLKDLLGAYELLPAVWAWLVRDTNQTAFNPHRDQARDVDVDDDEHLDYLTIWIPLTDLNHLSSSICVVPASADPEYDAGTDRVLVEDLQSIRSLQGPRGSVFCWTTGLIHWGTRQTRFGPPRMSIGYYVQNADAEVLDPPVMDFSQPLPLVRRLSIIGQQILNYSRDESSALLELAAGLVKLDAGREGLFETS